MHTIYYIATHLSYKLLSLDLRWYWRKTNQFHVRFQPVEQRMKIVQCYTYTVGLLTNRTQHARVHTKLENIIFLKENWIHMLILVRSCPFILVHSQALIWLSCMTWWIYIVYVANWIMRWLKNNNGGVSL